MPVSLQAAVPDCLGELTGLTKLILDGNGLKSLPASIGSLSELNTLNMANTQLTELPESIYGLKILKKLNLSGNQISADQLKTLAERLPDCNIKYIREPNV